MPSLADLRMYTRFAAGLRPFLRTTITAEQARAQLSRGLAEREASFLRLVERGVFAQPRSPYQRLFAHAGCGLEELRGMVRADGLETALERLREAGVYVTFEEFKGYQPIVRGSTTIPVRPRDFDNPLLSRSYGAQSSGSTGAGTRVWLDLDHLATLAAHQLVALDAHGLAGAPLGLWRGILPSAAGVNTLLRATRGGMMPERWFTPVVGRDFGSLRYRVATHCLVALARLHGPGGRGRRAPWPEPVRLDDALVVARWARAAANRHGSSVVNATTSQSVRVSAAARAAGVSLGGVAFLLGGEPVTPAKANEIRAAGARLVPAYHFVEAGAVGMACARPADDSDVHLLSDVVAVVQHRRHIPEADATVGALSFTSLLPTAPKILINTESDDFAVLERRACGCPFDALGYRLHARQIFSYRKLTGEGVTLVGSEMVRILEEVLPARCGGSAVDYQLLEEEQEEGRTRLVVLVSPRVELADELQVVEAVLDGLRGRPGGATVARAVWRQAGTLAVRRAEPRLTPRGKLLPLHVSRRS
jgi:hypothetical protein